MISRSRFLLILLSTLVLLPIGPTFAGNAAPASANAALPGVDGDYRIVKPAEPDQTNATSGHFKIGDVDVRVSGSLTMDVGAGKLALPKH